MHFPVTARLFPAVFSSGLPWPISDDLVEWGEVGEGNLLVSSEGSLSSLNNMT